MDDDEPNCHDCADFGCPGHRTCDQCSDDVCNECGGCACAETYCPGYIAHYTGTEV